MFVNRKKTVAVLLLVYLLQVLLPAYIVVDSAKQPIDAYEYVGMYETTLKIPENIKQFIENFKTNNKTEHISHLIFRFLRTSVQKITYILFEYRVADFLSIGMLIIIYIFGIDGKKRYNNISFINTI